MSPLPNRTSRTDDYFNDLSQQPQHLEFDNADDGAMAAGAAGADNNAIPKPKRIACILCRKRKLRCDGVKPSCGTCTRLQHECCYDEVRRKSGPKRGYVKALEARLAQVETLLNKKEVPPQKDSAVDRIILSSAPAQNTSYGQPLSLDNVDLNDQIDASLCSFDAAPEPQLNTTSISTGCGIAEPPMQPDAFPWEMIGLGLDEPLPAQDVIDDLNQAYFDKVHLSLPMIHRRRYYAAMNLAPHLRPPVCLRYAMWANAAAITEKYEALQEHFYQRSRKYIQQDEMKGHGESMITIAHCQTWCLLASYEFKLMYFPRAWVSAGRACRLAQMMGIHRIDNQGLDVKQCIPPPKDWTDGEERRRTFWMSFCVDRYSSIGTGWPMTIEEEDIRTCLPVDEQSYDLGRPKSSLSLKEALEPTGVQKLTGFAGVVVMACLFGRNLTHLHRPAADDKDDDLNGEFWRRHRAMDTVLLNTSLALPEACRLPAGLSDPNIVFMNMNIHASAICLHQAAIFKADKNRMPSHISAESKIRCITAAAEIAVIMRTISHLDLATMNPFISFCLYVAARVFVQYLKSRPTDAPIKTSLQFLLTAMHALKRKNPLTESFLVQLDVDLEGAGLEDTKALRAQSKAHSGRDLPEYINQKTYRPPESEFPVTFENYGLSAYSTNGTLESSGVASYSGLSDAGATSHPAIGINQVELPSRQRTPGSFGQAGSSNNDSIQMDTSPDGSGHDHLSPQSGSNQNASARSSNTSYSPSNQHNSHPISTPNRKSALFKGADATLPADFNLRDFSASSENQRRQGFELPTTWSADSVGFTPAASGLTPGAINEVMNMSESDWDQMLEIMNKQDSSHSGLPESWADGVEQSKSWGL